MTSGFASVRVLPNAKVAASVDALCSGFAVSGNAIAPSYRIRDGDRNCWLGTYLERVKDRLQLLSCPFRNINTV